jgi:cardiolipin synthase
MKASLLMKTRSRNHFKNAPFCEPRVNGRPYRIGSRLRSCFAGLCRGPLLVLLALLANSATAQVWLTPGNQISPLRTGADLNQARLNLIQEARQFIYIKTFIINRDDTENAVYSALCERARGGLDVRILVDDLGRRQGGNPMRSSGERYSIEGLRSCGIRFESFAPPLWGPVAFLLYNQHDKMLVTEQAAILGGTNFSRHYSQHAQLSPHWYDFDLLVRGPAACSLQRVFSQSWRQVEQKTRDLLSRHMRDLLTPAIQRRFSSATLVEHCTATRAPEGDSLMILYGNPYVSQERPFLAYFETAMTALRSQPSSEDRVIRLYAPYFVPSAEFSAQLVGAARHGIRVQIITNSESSIDPEAAPAYAAMLMRARDLLRAGVELYLWNPATTSNALSRNNVFHRKGGCFGTRNCFVGSHNLDVRGDEYSSELVAVFSDQRLVQEQIQDFEADLTFSTRILENDRARLLGATRLRDRAAATAFGWAM